MRYTGDSSERRTMATSDALSITTEQFWQMLELVASPDCDADTDELAEALGMIANGSESDRVEGARRLRSEVSKYLPDFG